MIGSHTVTWILLAAIALLVWEMLFRLASSPGTQESDGGEDEVTFSGNSHFTRRFIVTHFDFDGFACSALLYRLFRDDATLIFTTPRTLRRALGDALLRMTRGDSLYVADLAVNPEQEPEITEILKKMNALNIRVSWFDHHQWPMGLMERIGAHLEKLVVDVHAGTAAELIRRELPREDHTADKILRLVKGEAFPAEKEWNSSWRYLLAEISNRRDYELAESALQTLAAGEPLDPAMRYYVRKGKKRERTTQAVAESPHPMETTSHGRKFLIIDVRTFRVSENDGKPLFIISGKKPSVTVGRLACRFHEADFCLVVWNNFRYSLYRGVDRFLDFSELFPEIDYHGARFRISGHGYAASVTVPVTFRRYFQAIVSWKLPEAVTHLVDFLKEKY